MKGLNGTNAIRAYSDLYLDTSTRILGDAFDFAVNTCGYSLDEFVNMFVVSDSSKQFARGNPSYVAGINGCELVRKVIKESENREIKEDDIMYLDKSPEYWVGYVSAFYQWYSDESFMNLFDCILPEDMLKMYAVYHEMDIMKTVNEFSERIRKKRMITRLALYRKAVDLTQKELAEEAGVPLRQIQLFEQRERNINNAKFETVYRISKALNCKAEDLFERSY